jgi:hypothetical protein
LLEGKMAVASVVSTDTRGPLRLHDVTRHTSTPTDTSNAKTEIHNESTTARSRHVAVDS